MNGVQFSSRKVSQVERIAVTAEHQCYLIYSNILVMLYF